MCCRTTYHAESGRFQPFQPDQGRTVPGFPYRLNRPMHGRSSPPCLRKLPVCRSNVCLLADSVWFRQPANVFSPGQADPAISNSGCLRKKGMHFHLQSQHKNRIRARNTGGQSVACISMFPCKEDKGPVLPAALLAKGRPLQSGKSAANGTDDPTLAGNRIVIDRIQADP